MQQLILINRGKSPLAIILIFFMIACTNMDKPVEPAPDSNPVRNLELREKYETLLFNHLSVRGELPMKSRFEAIQNMASDGFKPAELALALYDIEHSDLKTKDKHAERMLEAMAETGNVTAQCLYAFYWGSAHAPERWRQYVLSSSNADVAYCMNLRASYLEKNGSEEQLDWRYKSALKGGRSGQVGMAHAYYKGEGVPKDIERATCWAIEAKNSGGNSGQTMYQVMMHFYRQEKHDFGASPPDAQFCKSAIQQKPQKLSAL